ncbi:MAG: PHP domain-containing protein [Treponema sp.]|jgi:predicted metal-dependent phosphoesterase TrpH|nr:PHP domain-containing protein [Treponema sp.]
MTTMIDLHTHSNASDGSLSPVSLIREAVRLGISAIALTDHDSIKGLSFARNEAEALGIRFIPGIEIEINHPYPGQFHLLGLGIVRPSPAFIEAVAGLSRLREERNREILERVRQMGLETTWDEMLGLARGDSAAGAEGGLQAKKAGPAPSIGRPHFATLLVRRGIVRNQEQAFDRYLKPGKPLYVPKAGLDFDTAQALIRESGGLPVLAHPMSLYVSLNRLPALLEDLKNRGLAGIEAWHPTAKLRECRRLEELARNLGLYVSAGSDFHGENRPGRSLGHSCAGRPIEDSILEAIPELSARSCQQSCRQSS